MKRLRSCDSLVPIHRLEWLEDDDDDADEGGGMASIVYCSGEKKRRLSAEQVRALEKNFELENKLEPERKARLAQTLGLQPRQVAVWFQNRRARWKTKQLERDYAALKSRYDSLRHEYDSLLRCNESLIADVKELRAKLNCEEESLSESENKAVMAKEEEEEEEEVTLIYNKDGSSDSDSSAAAANTNSNSSLSSSFVFQQPQQLQILKVEDDEFLAGDEPCSSFFHEQQAPKLSWYCGGGWE